MFPNGAFVAGLLFVLGLFSSCEETVKLDLKQTESRIVVEGLVTTDSTRHFVKLSRTLDFYSKETPPAVRNARISVTDGTQIWNYSERPERPGYYVSDEAFAGVVGKFYRVVIEVGDKRIEGGDELIRVTEIDSITYLLDEDRLDLPSSGFTEEERMRVFALLFFTKEPQATKDFYLFKQYRNSERVDDNGTTILVSDDEILQENINAVQLLDFYAPGDTALVEMYSISRAAFIYYNDLNTVLNNDGGLFGPIPADPRSNLSGGALGLFQVSDVRRAARIAPENP